MQRWQKMQEQIFQSIFITPCYFPEKRASNFSKYVCQLFFAIVRLAALEMCEDISIEIVPISHWTFTCFSKNDHTFPQFFSKSISIGCLSLIQGRSQNLKEVPQSFTEVFTLMTSHLVISCGETNIAKRKYKLEFQSNQ